MCIFTLRPSSSPCNLFPILFIHLVLCNVLCVPKFCSKIVLLPLYPVAGMSSCILPLLLGGIFFRCFVVSCLVCIVWSYLENILVLLLLPVTSSSCIVNFNCCLVFLFSPKHILVFFLCLGIFACNRRFFKSFSSLISHPGFDFLSVFFRVTPISWQTNFTPE